MRSFAALLSLSLLACVVPGPGMVPGDDDDAPPPAQTQVSGDITAPATWEGTVDVIGQTTIKTGVTITISAGATLRFVDTAGLTVEGVLDVQGTAAAQVVFAPTGTDWPGVIVAAGGALTLRGAHLSKAGTAVECAAGALSCAIDATIITDNQQSAAFYAPASVTASTLEKSAGAGIYVGAGGDVDIVDSHLTTAGGDIVVQGGGKLRIDYSEIGKVLDSYEHCGIHINAAEELTIEHSELHSNVVAAMIGGTTNARINSSNWRENPTDIQETGVNSGLDLTGNYWALGAPTGNFDATGAVLAPLVAGPR